MTVGSGWTPDDTACRVLVGVDGGPAGRAALAAVGHEARARQLDVIALHVRPGMTPVEALGSAFTGASGMCWLDCRDHAELNAWLDCVQWLEPQGLRWQFQVREGDPAIRLEEAAGQLRVRSIYLAARERTWWARQLHHCPARALARHHERTVHLVNY